VRRLFISVTLIALAVSFAVAATIGSGSPSAAIQQSFVNAYNRGQFPLLVNPVPLADVRALGTPGLVQEFSPRTGGTAKFALVKPDPNAPVAQLDTLQILSDVYAYYTTVGVNTAGYPLNDTQICPTNSVGACNYQIFSKNYGLFVFSAPSVNLTVRDPFYTAWNNNGGIGGVPGVVISAEAPVTSVSKVQATQQLFDGASLFSYPVGSATPTVRSVVGAFNTAYGNSGGLAALGLPTSDVQTQTASGLMRQTFEYGRIEQISGGMPIVLFALSNLDITYANLGLSLNQGGAATISATTLDLHGFSVTDRTLNWTSTNGAVAKVTGNGYTAVVEGVSGGSAQIYVTAEGKTSAPLAVRVGSVCCLIGEGAPTPAQTQAFQNAVTRNNLSVATPVAAPVTRQGAGYNQILAAADGSAVYVVALADKSGIAYVLTGPLYTAYLANGGFTGPVGYPSSDLLPGGVQRFTSGAALAGSPVRLIPANIASKWFQLGGMVGQAGAPVADAVAFTSSTGMSGIAQSFAGGAFFSVASGSAAGQAYFASGAILGRYLALSGTAGALGVPTGDIFGTTVLTQNFEGGYIDLQPGAAVAVEHFNPRRPAISATPAIVVPGGRVRISATGFTPASTLSITITGQPAFSVVSPAGAYTWDVVIPAGAKSATVAIQASATPGTDAASTSYTVTSVPALLPKFRILSGDQQTGAPGAALPTPITALLTDSGGVPIAGVPVSWTTSPGASLQSSFVTDSAGRVSATFRLPATAGVAVGSLAAGGQAVQFSALASSRSIQAYPAFAIADPQGALVATLASLLRQSQNGGAIPISNGVASPDSLTSWLAGNNGYSAADSGAQVANPWVAAQFAKAGLFLEPTALPGVVDLVSAGTPVGLILNLTADGVASGHTAVSAIGVNADGSLAISDPNPAFARASLGDYLNGFTAQSKVVKGALSAVLRVGSATTGAAAAPFVVAAPFSAKASANSPVGACSLLPISDSAASGVTFLYCDGSQPVYELDLAVSKVATVVDLTGAAPVTLPANGTLAWQLGRAAGVIQPVVQTLSISAVTDSASFGPGLSPGGLFTIFGAGFTANSTATLAGTPVQLVATFPFQINALIPVGTAPGKAALQVTGLLGNASKDVTIAAISPGIFLLGSNVQGAILNLPDATINSPEFPAQRGQFISIYSTGLGATVLRNGLQATATPVSAVVNTVTIPSSFAGLTPGFVGLYQVNVQLPANLPPTLNGTLLLLQGGQTSNTVALAVQ
jgi:uncharacterized protein (TIGR03437 family)